MKLRKYGLPFIFVLIIACGKSSEQNYYPDIIKGNWAVISRGAAVGYNYLPGFYVYYQLYGPGSDSLAVNFNNNQFTFSYLSGGYTGSISFSDTIPTFPPLHLNQNHGSYQVINDSEVIILPDTSALLKYCNSVENDSLVVSVSDTIHFTKQGADSLTISQNLMTPNQIPIHTVIGLRMLR